MASISQTKAAILSDSWLVPRRFVHRSIYSKGNQMVMNILPHTAEHGDDIVLENLSRGGLTLENIINNRENILQRWVDIRPQVTLIHALGCDIANNNASSNTQGSGPSYVHGIFRALHQMLDFMKSKMNTTEYFKWNRKHKFILVAAPDWGEFPKTRPNSLNALQYRSLRSKINQQLKKKRVKFWREVNTLVLTPRMNNAQLLGVHLETESQRAFNQHIIQSIGRVLCNKCSLEKLETSKRLERALVEGCSASGRV